MTADAGALDPHPAVAASVHDRGLVLAPQGEAVFAAAPAQATTFASMREAARAALRPSGSLRTFSLAAPGGLAAPGAVR
ncbi:MAG: hypothetical protein JO127_01115 [Caulobacteraceae bacterium]|nr:hypothetical protein [Caulobacteraceae bacterium]